MASGPMPASAVRLGRGPGHAGTIVLRGGSVTATSGPGGELRHAGRAGPRAAASSRTATARTRCHRPCSRWRRSRCTSFAAAHTASGSASERGTRPRRRPQPSRASRTGRSTRRGPCGRRSSARRWRGPCACLTSSATSLDEASPGVVRFTRDGAEHELDALEGGEGGELWLIFGDATNGSETYGGGRFLYTAPPAADGSVLVDFNRAYNPPCVFSPYATCPLPPTRNRLSLRIEAGEQEWHG